MLLKNEGKVTFFSELFRPVRAKNCTIQSWRHGYRSGLLQRMLPLQSLWVTIYSAKSRRIFQHIWPFFHPATTAKLCLQAQDNIARVKEHITTHCCPRLDNTSKIMWTWPMVTPTFWVEDIFLNASAAKFPINYVISMPVKCILLSLNVCRSWSS